MSQHVEIKKINDSMILIRGREKRICCENLLHSYVALSS